MSVANISPMITEGYVTTLSLLRVHPQRLPIGYYYHTIAVRVKYNRLIEDLDEIYECPNPARKSRLPWNRREIIMYKVVGLCTAQDLAWKMPEKMIP